MVDGEQGVVGCTGSDHAVGVGQGGGEWFFAENAFDARLGRIDDKVGVAVVGGGDGDDVQLFIRQHFAVVFIAGSGLVRPLLYKVVEGLLV